MLYALCYIMPDILVSFNPLSNDLAKYTHYDFICK